MAFSFSFVKSKATIIQIIMNETKEAAQEPKPKPNPKKGKKANRRSRSDMSGRVIKHNSLRTCHAIHSIFLTKKCF